MSTSITKARSSKAVIIVFESVDWLDARALEVGSRRRQEKDANRLRLASRHEMLFLYLP